jgi:phosphate-selective porin OprO/OprP
MPCRHGAQCRKGASKFQEEKVRKQLAAAGFLALALVSQNAGAKTLEDVLKEKGVITEEDYKEVTKIQPVKYKLGQGFTLTSPDEKFQLSIGSQMQLRYTFLDQDNANNNFGATKAQDTSKFELKRIKLYFNGYAYTPDLTYKLQINFANINGGNTSNGGLLEETYMNYRIIDEAQLRFGQDKVGFGRQALNSTSAQQFVDRSAASDAFKYEYDTGLQVHGKIADGLVTYSTGIFGGLGQNTFRTSNDNAFNARITLNPLGEMKYVEADVDYSEKPLVAFGADYVSDTLKSVTSTTLENNQLSFAKAGTGWFAVGSPLMPAGKQFAANEKINFNCFSLDGAFKWRGLYAQGEYFLGQADGQTSHNTLRAQGFYAQAGYFVVPKYVEIAARYSYTDPNRDVSNDHWVETQGAISWYINKHNLKIQTDYTNIHKQKAIALNGGPNATDDKQVRVQAQLLF